MITDVTSTVLVVAAGNANACVSAQDTIVVEIHTDEGITGTTDANPWVIKALIRAPGSHILNLGLKELLLGQDPNEPTAIWNKLYLFTAMTGRRRAGISVIGALDMAVWDFYGKATGRTICQLLGGAQKDFVTHMRACFRQHQSRGLPPEPYPEGAMGAGIRLFQAVKVEICIKGPGRIGRKPFA
jgi:L-alanine-DL-glutamate epimerase-like enolase superfamily enzyme